MNLLILGDQMSIDYEILWKVSAGSPRHLAVDKPPPQLHDALCCQSRRFRPPGPSSTRMPALIAAAGKCLGDTISTATLWEAFRKLSGSFPFAGGMGASGIMDVALQAAVALPIGCVGVIFTK